MPKEFSAADRDRLTAAYRTLISTQLMPAYRRLHAYIADEYLPKTRDTFGMGALPNGAAWYAHKVHDNTTFSMSPAQVHQIGLDEVARIQDGMRAVAKDLGYTKPTKTLPELKAFFEWMKARDDMYFTSREELLSAYQKFHSRRRSAAADVFQPASQEQLRSAAGGAIPRSVGVFGFLPGPVARRQTQRRVLRERL